MPFCPEESVFAELAAGTLLEAERQELELHLDRCPACTELLGLLASLPSSSDRGRDASKLPVECAWWLTHDGALSLSLLVTQLFWFRVMWSPAFRCLSEAARFRHHWLPYLAFGYVVVIGALGTVISAAGVAVAYKRRKLPAQVSLLQVLVGVSTLALAPLALIIVFRLFAGRVQKTGPCGALPTVSAGRRARQVFSLK